MSQLIPDEDLIAARERYEQAQPKPAKTRAEILCEIVREDNSVTVRELAEAAERSPSWVRKILRANGLTAAGQRPRPTEPAEEQEEARP